MLKMLKSFNKKQILLFIISLIFIVIQVWLDLKIPDYMANITVLVETEGSLIKDVIIQGSYMLLCALGSLVAAFIVGYCSAYIGTFFGKNLRKQIFNKVNEFNMEEIKKFSTSSLITRNTNDVTQVQTFLIMAIQMLIKSPIMAIWAITKIANKGFEFSLITAIGVGVILILVICLIILVLPKFKIIQTLTDNLNRITRENLTGIRVVRAFNAEKYQEEKFDKANDTFTKISMFTQKAMALLSPVINLVMLGISLAIYWVGAYIINSTLGLEKLTIFGNMVVFSSYAIQVIMSFMMLVIIFILYPRASVSVKRINEVLDTKSKITNGIVSSSTNNLKGVVEFSSVSFKYPDASEYVLKNINFKIKTGEIVAFIGSTGSGKSTLINLIPRFYDATSGKVLVDGIDVKEMDLSYLHNKLGYVSQKAILFKGSVKDNISFGQSINGKPSIKKIEEAITVAQAEEFVNKMENGYDAKVSQGGTNISGGQKQRLSIARAIAKDPEIYIFDDSFSALDYKTDLLLRRKLKQYAKDATLLIVAQRIGTIKNADKIVVLDDGECVGIGTHEELLKNCKVYQEIASSQLSKEELANEQ